MATFSFYITNFVFVNPSPLPSLPVETNVLPPTLWNKPLPMHTWERLCTLCRELLHKKCCSLCSHISTNDRLSFFMTKKYSLVYNSTFSLSINNWWAVGMSTYCEDGWWYFKCGRVGIFSHCIDFISHKYMPITVISTLYGCSYIFSLKIALIIFIVALLICISVNNT